ncbi:putative dTDP-4-dehydrorhamnose reductase domain protein [Acanthamoeba castellanii mimivirus]|uniref:Uncharacterized protein L780 n=6 Tax=Mimivirus TaxID=315393 RepID=YL780_MIMIV|nr:uncharacterized dTDP-4-dehydrorhamnose reductase domain protein [Acanthamoeba polyphaga mimivirus]Q5UPS5.1 RecName: Full=Uncharacterized protein L780 [Acanthamoeba polyphaga mimivirus]AEQ60995.1 dTDP-4-dehydrorhamnose reductase [Acanthamoeba castellanii mamavirus]AHA45048.1 putative dTDP-4-dehydrorhamnose reductase domain protein [Hirudovirus strain Sangsue]ALR84401.1 dTDP-4-dehydrorhamnose reductase [Niemeyer virus]AMK62045.1 dTDP-4-dehydrorhamnose reductase [Samba virus]AMZ03222.1 putati
MKWLIFGNKGWIGSMVSKILEQQGEQVVGAQSRADDESAVEREISEIKPDRVMSFIGRTHGPGYSTIDYLEQSGKLVENVKDNLYGPLCLAFICQKYNIHLTYLGTGCIFEGQNNFSADEKGFTENDKPNFFGSSYSVVKGFTDRLMHFFDNDVLNLRIRMPITIEQNPRSFITKILSYSRICSIPNSMTILDQMIPVMIDMARNKTTGTFNFTNPGLVSHNEILSLIRDIHKPNLTWENMSREQQLAILKADRSNNLLNTDKLQSLYPDVPDILTGIREVVSKMKFQQ